MARRTPIFTMLDAAIVSSGLTPDRHPVLSPLWAVADNARFWGGKVRRRVPPANAFQGSAHPVRGLSQQQVQDGTRWLWAATGGDVYKWYGPAATSVIAGATWHEDQDLINNPTFWDFTHFGDWTIINSGIGKAKISKPPVAVADYGDADTPSDVVTYAKMLNFIVAVGYGPRGTAVAWSNADSIENWTPPVDSTDDSLAGDLVFDDMQTRIKAAARIGQALAVYAEDQMGLLSFIGNPFLFSQKVVLDGIGAIGKMSVCSDGKSNYGVGRAGIWWTDSNSYRYIDVGALSDYLQDNVNWDQGGKITACRNDYTGCFEFYFPIKPSLVCNEGWSYDPQTGGWSKLPGSSLKDERRLFQFVINGTTDGHVQFDEDNPDVAAPLALTTKPLVMQVQSADGSIVDAHTDSRVDEVLFLLKRASNVQFRIGCAQFSDDPPVWSPWQDLSLTTDTYLIPSMPSGVVWMLDFRSTADNWDIDLQGFILWGAVEGVQRAKA